MKPRRAGLPSLEGPPYSERIEKSKKRRRKLRWKLKMRR
jgi:hypothetical protein